MTRPRNIYYYPEDQGLTLVIEVGRYDYDFNIAAVYRTADGRLVGGTDSGCSCYSPFDGETVESLTHFKDERDAYDFLASWIDDVDEWSLTPDGKITQKAAARARLLGKESV